MKTRYKRPAWAKVGEEGAGDGGGDPLTQATARPTPMELVGQIYQIQGYVVMGAASHYPPFKVGAIHTETMNALTGSLQIPLRILGPSTEEEFNRQEVLMLELAGVTVGETAVGLNRYTHFYRVEAVD